MTTILSISAFYHDTHAALVVDGAIVAAAPEERRTRRKRDQHVPRHEIANLASFARRSAHSRGAGIAWGSGWAAPGADLIAADGFGARRGPGCAPAAMRRIPGAGRGCRQPGLDFRRIANDVLVPLVSGVASDSCSRWRSRVIDPEHSAVVNRLPVLGAAGAEDATDSTFPIQ
jgi:hypothetical protein